MPGFASKCGRCESLDDAFAGKLDQLKVVIAALGAAVVGEELNVAALRALGAEQLALFQRIIVSLYEAARARGHARTRIGVRGMIERLEQDHVGALCAALSADQLHIGKLLHLMRTRLAAELANGFVDHHEAACAIHVAIALGAAAGVHRTIAIEGGTAVTEILVRFALGDEADLLHEGKVLGNHEGRRLQRVDLFGLDAGALLQQTPALFVHLFQVERMCMLYVAVCGATDQDGRAARLLGPLAGLLNGGNDDGSGAIRVLGGAGSVYEIGDQRVGGRFHVLPNVLAGLLCELNIGLLDDAFAAGSRGTGIGDVQAKERILDVSLGQAIFLHVIVGIAFHHDAAFIGLEAGVGVVLPADTGNCVQIRRGLGLTEERGLMI